MLTEADLDEVEKVSTENISPYLSGTEGNFHLELSKLWMRELNCMEGGGKEPSGHGFKGEAGTTEHIEPNRSPYLPVEERSFGTGIQSGLGIDPQRRICDVRKTELEQRKPPPILIVAVLELMGVRDRSHVVMPYSPSRTTPG